MITGALLGFCMSILMFLQTQAQLDKVMHLYNSDPIIRLLGRRMRIYPHKGNIIFKVTVWTIGGGVAGYFLS